MLVRALPREDDFLWGGNTISRIKIYLFDLSRECAEPTFSK